jgi:hypothetical protein
MRKLHVAIFISNKKKMSFFVLFSSTKLQNRKAEQVLLRGKSWCQWKGGGGEEKG